MATQLTEDGRDSERAQRLPPIRVVALDCSDEPDARDLLEVVSGFAGVRIAPGEARGERPVAGDQLIERGAVTAAMASDKLVVIELRAEQDSCGHGLEPLDVANMATQSVCLPTSPSVRSSVLRSR